jgi:hypothetical protein
VLSSFLHKKQPLQFGQTRTDSSFAAPRALPKEPQQCLILKSEVLRRLQAAPAALRRNQAAQACTRTGPMLLMCALLLPHDKHCQRRQNNSRCWNHRRSGGSRLCLQHCAGIRQRRCAHVHTCSFASDVCSASAARQALPKETKYFPVLKSQAPWCPQAVPAALRRNPVREKRPYSMWGCTHQRRQPQIAMCRKRTALCASLVKQQQSQHTRVVSAGPAVCTLLCADRPQTRHACPLLQLLLGCWPKPQPAASRQCRGFGTYRALWTPGAPAALLLMLAPAAAAARPCGSGPRRAHKLVHS